MHQIRQNARPTSVRRAMRLSDERARWSRRSIDDPDRAPRRSSARRGAIWALSLWSGLSLLSLSLFLSLSFRKWFEVKMRGENDFRVKCENIGQPKVIFRKMIFSVTAKHSGFMKNDFWKQFSPNSNTPLVNADNQLHLSKEKPHQLQGVHCWSHTIFT